MVVELELVEVLLELDDVDELVLVELEELDVDELVELELLELDVEVEVEVVEVANCVTNRFQVAVVPDVACLI